MKIFLIRAAMLISVIVLGGLSLAIVRAASLSSSAEPAELDRPSLTDERVIVKRLAHALTIPTLSPTPSEPQLERFGELHAELEAWFPRVHARAEKEVINGATLLFTIRGSEPELPGVAFLAHQDVVPVEEGTEREWTHPPFSGAVEDGYIWGRGALDNKHNVMALLEALEHLLESGELPQHTLYLVFGHDEEVGGMHGARVVAEGFKSEGVELAAVYDEGLIIADGIVPGIDGAIALVGITEKGYVTLEVTASSDGGHASMPPKELAAVKLSRALERLYESPMRAAIDGPTRRMFDEAAPHMDFGMRLVFGNLWLTEPLVISQMAKSPSTHAALRTTIAPTMLRASPRENVLPQQATATLNIRIHPRDSIASVIAHVNEVVDDPTISVTPVSDMRAEPGPVASMESQGFLALRDAIHEVFGPIPVAPNMLIAAADARHFTSLTSNVFRFQAVALTSNDLERIHGTDERISTEAYLDLVRFYVQLLRKW
ncbi:M20/M25/M40 family metallo-hydrolase [Lujinxingia sediminis]|uniref:M20/M25/M40 family metallo-hydrolase n=1 Tax=Lujinxingia sediminis TaxID=2480984 RepID=A0ABY0CWZ7_9DELT|nr:M20/M25/M40 family metallo-hydrolase [Lujinxingia sediminis]RVU48139.1 M20/M25/M40 family metallo-hydrolase [Lujinxingia sediminis]